MQFQFNGDWETKIELQALKGFQSRNGWYGSTDSSATSDGVVKLSIADELDGNPDPSSEQLAAIDFLLTNQDAVVANILKKITQEYPVLKEAYGYNGTEEAQFFPPIDSPDDLKKCIGFHTLFVLLPHKDGYAYIGFEGGCTWDDEHGIGLVVHRDRVISFGAADEAFSAWKAYEDNGTADEMRSRWQQVNNDRSKLPKPTRYLPHAKYGKLKPSQVDANKGYEYHLIERGYNDEFITLIESGEITVNDNTGWISMTFLERACQFRNTVIIEYILSKNPKSLKNCIQDVAGWKDKNLVKLFLAHGVDIDEVNNVGETALSRHISSLAHAHYHKLSETEIAATKDMIEFLISLGADPYKKNVRGEDLFARLEHSDKKEEMLEFLTMAVAKNAKKK